MPLAVSFVVVHHTMQAHHLLLCVLDQLDVLLLSNIRCDQDVLRERSLACDIKLELRVVRSNSNIAVCLHVNRITGGTSLHAEGRGRRGGRASSTCSGVYQTQRVVYPLPKYPPLRITTPQLCCGKVVAIRLSLHAHVRSVIAKSTSLYVHGEVDMRIISTNTDVLPIGYRQQSLYVVFVCRLSRVKLDSTASSRRAGRISAL
mmetsp:Transcript_40382/g.104686  ORF Transcript_40382/g.104686 Transcript_40382/m.104686 type:complete len:203 (+) Transcript_40382:1257-1865(+)